MTLEQKNHYQDFIFHCQAKYFEGIKVTRGKATLKGYIAVLVPQDKLEAPKAIMVEMVNK